MYTYYCKDTNCPGHTKSWERCCDLRAFSTNTMPKRQTHKPTATLMQTMCTYQPLKKQAYA